MIERRHRGVSGLRTLVSWDTGVATGRFVAYYLRWANVSDAERKIKGSP
jgi:hypothetical protein